MIPRESLDTAQREAITFAAQREATLLVLPVGFGKSVVSLTAAIDRGVKRVLVIAPVSVCKHTWAHEADKWAHLSGLSVGVVSGTLKQREAVVNRNPDVLAINPESLAWYFTAYGESGVREGLIIDELTRFKSTGAVSYRALRKWCKRFSWRVGMTATPVEENLLDIYAEMLLLDPTIFGTRKDAFTRRYFDDVGYMYPKLIPKANSCEEIVNEIGGLTFFAARGSYSGLPDLEILRLDVEVSKRVRDIGAELIRNRVTTIDGAVIACDNAAVLQGKLSQLANGFIYDEDGEPIWIDDGKLRATLEDVTEESHGEPVLYVYTYRAQARRLAELGAGIEFLNGGKDDGERIAAWNRGELRGLALHPKSAGHGLNLQHGGWRVVLLAPIWSADLWHQVIGRVHRRGSPFTSVEVLVAVSVGSVEELMLKRLDSKKARALAFDKYLSGLS